MTTLSTHVLDAAQGVPASGLDVVLADEKDVFIAAATTDADGRIAWADDLERGTYTLTFATGEWFEAFDRSTFYPMITLTISLGRDHDHVALLLSPFSYTTYKGS